MLIFLHQFSPIWRRIFHLKELGRVYLSRSVYSALYGTMIYPYFALLKMWLKLRIHLSLPKCRASLRALSTLFHCHQTSIVKCSSIRTLMHLAMNRETIKEKINSTIPSIFALIQNDHRSISSSHDRAVYSRISGLVYFPVTVNKI